MNLFLCSHFSSVGSLIKEEIENKKVAFIPTASLREGYTGYVGSARKLFKKLGAIVTEIDISTEAYSTIQSVFEDADVIYFTGGNSFLLIDQLRKTGTDDKYSNPVQATSNGNTAVMKQRIEAARGDVIELKITNENTQLIPETGVRLRTSRHVWLLFAISIIMILFFRRRRKIR